MFEVDETNTPYKYCDACGTVDLWKFPQNPQVKYCGTCFEWLLEGALSRVYLRQRHTASFEKVKPCVFYVQKQSYETWTRPMTDMSVWVCSDVALAKDALRTDTGYYVKDRSELLHPR